MKLEDLVPSLELCRQIPAGEFEDSALVWHSENEWILNRADDLFGDEPIVPAPTLAEIMVALSRMEKIDMVNVWAEGFGWNAQTISNSVRSKTAIKKDKTPATAALKLWLEVRK